MSLNILLSSRNSGNSEVSSEGSKSGGGQRAGIRGEVQSSGLVFRAQRNLASTFKKLRHTLDSSGVPNFRGCRLVVRRKLTPTRSCGVTEFARLVRRMIKVLDLRSLIELREQWLIFELRYNQEVLQYKYLVLLIVKAIRRYSGVV